MSSLFFLSLKKKKQLLKRRRASQTISWNRRVPAASLMTSQGCITNELSRFEPVGALAHCSNKWFPHNKTAHPHTPPSPSSSIPPSLTSKSPGQGRWRQREREGEGRCRTRGKELREKELEEKKSFSFLLGPPVGMMPQAPLDRQQSEATLHGAVTIFQPAEEG